MSISEKLLEVREYSGIGYKPLIDFGAWRVAILRYHPELLPEHITNMQRHDETDEVFVLLEGRCILFLGAGGDSITDVFAEDMEPLKLYNVKRAVWHSHTLSEDAVVLIVENMDTTDENSSEVDLSSDQQKELVRLAQAAW